MNEPNYKAEPSYDLRDALKLPILFHAGGPWDAPREAEWLRITGTREASTKVMCDHLRSALAIVTAELQPGSLAETFNELAVGHCLDKQAAADALAKLSNEVLGSLPLVEPLARREFGNTNYAILIQRAEEARAVVAKVNGRAP